MNFELEPGKYVVAVSGGVDSMALLHMLSQLPREQYQFVVAHLDHGIRPDAAVDRRLVREVAAIYELPFVYEEAKLGPDASESTAREARYAFLRQIRKNENAQAIITAHHQDDVLETAVLNLMRGTNRKGLSSLRSHADIVRPLLHVSKQELLAYAKAHKLQWREDSTNQDLKYARNKIRHTVLREMPEQDRERLASIVAAQASLNDEIDSLVEGLLETHLHNDQLDRDWFTSLPENIAREVLAVWLRGRGLRNFDRKTLERLVTASQQLSPGSLADIKNGVSLEIHRKTLALRGLER